MTVVFKLGLIEIFPLVSSISCKHNYTYSPVLGRGTRIESHWDYDSVICHKRRSHFTESCSTRFMSKSTLFDVGNKD